MTFDVRFREKKIFRNKVSETLKHAAAHSEIDLIQKKSFFIQSDNCTDKMSKDFSERRDILKTWLYTIHHHPFQFSSVLIHPNVIP